MGHPVIAFICQWGKYAHPVQFIRNMGSAKPFQTLSENIPHHTRRIFVNFQTFMLIAGFYITVNGKGSDKITAAAFHIQGAPGLYRNIPAVCLIHKFLTETVRSSAASVSVSTLSLMAIKRTP